MLRSSFQRFQQGPLSFPDGHHMSSFPSWIYYHVQWYTWIFLYCKICNIMMASIYFLSWYGYNLHPLYPKMLSPWFPMDKSLVPRPRMERAGIRADVRIFNAAVNACAQVPRRMWRYQAVEMHWDVMGCFLGCNEWDIWYWLLYTCISQYMPCIFHVYSMSVNIQCIYIILIGIWWNVCWDWTNLVIEPTICFMEYIGI